MPRIEIPITDIVVKVIGIHHICPSEGAEVELNVSMGRGGPEWFSQAFRVRVGDEFVIPLKPDSNEGEGRSGTWPLANVYKGGEGV